MNASDLRPADRGAIPQMRIFLPLAFLTIIFAATVGTTHKDNVINRDSIN